MSANDIKEIFENAADDLITNNNFQDDNEIPIAQAPYIKEQAFYGVLKKIVDVSTINSEASPVAVSANTIAWFSTIIGRLVYQWVGDTMIHCRPFPLLVGRSGKARKGTSEALPRRIFARVDEIRRKKNINHSSLNIHGGGLSSGEGICFAIRDPSDDGKDSGIVDKRLLVLETEFANVLANCKRDKSTLSPVIRNVFDGRTLSPLTKNNRTCATDPHVVIVGHITGYELQNKIHTGLEVNNGLLNRFLILYVAREKLVPLPFMTPPETINELASIFVDILEFVDDNVKANKGALEIRMSVEAEKFWIKVYPELSRDTLGLIGSLLARSEVYARMLAMIFAIMDKKIIIEISHLRAALYWMAYVKQSVQYLFGNAVEERNENELDVLANDILSKLKTQGSLTKTGLSNAFNRHKTSAQIHDALERLLNQSPSPIVQIKERTSGRSKVTFRLKEENNAKKAI